MGWRSWLGSLIEGEGGGESGKKKRREEERREKEANATASAGETT